MIALYCVCLIALFVLILPERKGYTPRPSKLMRPPKGGTGATKIVRNV